MSFDPDSLNFTPEQAQELERIIARAKRIYGIGLSKIVIEAFDLYDKENELLEKALAEKGRKPG